MRLFLSACFFVALAVSGFAQQTPQNGNAYPFTKGTLIAQPTPADNDSALKSLSTNALIEKLQEVEPQPPPWVSDAAQQLVSLNFGFLAFKREYPHILSGWAASPTPPVIRELVCRGAPALPKLIAHLSDARPTKLVIDWTKMKKVVAMVDAYDPRFYDPKKQPSTVNTIKLTNHHLKTFPTYTVKVGDLCYIIIGQIVNRRLVVLAGSGFKTMIVNSPVETPALADAVKADWRGVTPEAHEQSLQKDVFNELDPTDALVRLWFYDSKIGTPLITKMLERPFYDYQMTHRFFEKKLAATPIFTSRKSLITNFQKTHDETANIGLLRVILWPEGPFHKPDMTPSRLTKREAISNTLLAQFYPTIDPYHLPFPNAASVQDQVKLISGLRDVHSPEIDDAILRLMKRTAPLPMGVEDDPRYFQLMLIKMCIGYLEKHEKHRDACIDAEKTTIAALKKARENSSSRKMKSHIDNDIHSFSRDVARALSPNQQFPF